MEESVLDKSQTMNGDLYQFFEQHYQEISDYVHAKESVSSVVMETHY